MYANMLSPPTPRPKSYIVPIEYCAALFPWSKPISFDHCDSSGCKKYKSIGLDRKSVEISQSISIVNSDNGETISDLIVTGIKYGNQIRMCWINNDENNDPPSYIVVGGCKP